jgi:hypothetical protein
MHHKNVVFLSMLTLLCFVASSSAVNITFSTFTSAHDYQPADLDEILSRPRPEQSKVNLVFNKKFKFQVTLQSYDTDCNTAVLQMLTRMSGNKEDFDKQKISRCITVKSPLGASVKLHIKDQLVELLSKEILLGSKINIYGTHLYMIKSGPGIIVDKFELSEK